MGTGLARAYVSEGQRFRGFQPGAQLAVRPALVFTSQNRLVSARVVVALIWWSRHLRQVVQPSERCPVVAAASVVRGSRVRRVHRRSSFATHRRSRWRTRLFLRGWVRVEGESTLDGFAFIEAVVRGHATDQISRDDGLSASQNDRFWLRELRSAGSNNGRDGGAAQSECRQPPGLSRENERF